MLERLITSCDVQCKTCRRRAYWSIDGMGQWCRGHARAVLAAWVAQGYPKYGWIRR